MDVKTVASSFMKGFEVDIEVENQVVTLLPEEVEVGSEAKEGWVVAEDQGLMVGINIVLTKELELEGLARDIVRRIQNQRKNADFRISDEIELYYVVGSKLASVFKAYRSYIMAETLSTALYPTEPPANAFEEKFDLAGEKLRIGLVRVEKED
jgi:isoleucyl-tRNA synthetase